MPADFQALVGTGRQVQGADLRPIGIDPALQREVDRPLLGRQGRPTPQLVTVFQVAIAGQLKLIELQGVRQIGADLEAVGGDLHPCRQVLRKGLHFSRQLTLQITAAVGLELQGLEQVALHIQRQRPRRATGRRQQQLAAYR